MDPLLIILASIGILLLLNNISKIKEFILFYQKFSKIPGPRYIPLVGPVFQLLKMDGHERLQWLAARDKQYKDGIYGMWVGSMAIVRIRNPAYLEVLLPSTVNIRKSRFYDFIRPWLGQGLLTSTGEKWFHDRRLITPAFHFSILEEYAVTMTEKAEILTKRLEETIKAKPGQSVDIFIFAVLCALDIICETAMGINLNVQDATSNEYAQTLQVYSRKVIDRFLKPWQILDAFYYLSREGKELSNAVEVMHEFTEQVIRSRKLARKQKSTKEEKEVEFDDFGKRKKKAFLDVLLDANEKDDNPLTDAEIREQVDTFMFAGHDTTAAAISWTLFCLGNELDIQEKVHEELDSVFGSSTTPATLKEISELKYLERVIKESLRLYPSAPEVSRRLVVDMKCGDHIIPKDCTAVISPYFTHRDPSIWKNPEKFDPDRFLPENSKNRHAYAYIPFSAGPRNCVGQKFAQNEEKIILTAVLRKFKVKSVKTHSEIRYHAALILRPCDGIHVYLTPRK